MCRKKSNGIGLGLTTLSLAHSMVLYPLKLKPILQGESGFRILCLLIDVKNERKVDAFVKAQKAYKRVHHR